ncbi:hypothetical protein D3P08_13580 [Paenibacillus nanensis]|uniref:Uncharacterized protein n=1 Tax=Paenibacillus nanensis TaxID=393251 RepID=A0A3A1UU05_9BACL|nr:hypothetical protein [Paenibacillus nanensis]RIX52008.1 hypothetical protein D3P08_13580 [Paenibacillus nanensis]
MLLFCLLVVCLAAVTVYFDYHSLKNKRVAVAYFSMYGIGLVIAILSILNRDLPGPIQLIHYMMDPIVKIVFKTI